VEYRLGGVPYMHLDAGLHYKLTPATSISVQTKDQAETDRLWAALLADCGKESMCGWLEDRFGVSWQTIPQALRTMMNAQDRQAATRARDAMMQMRKIDIAKLETAFAGK